MATPATTIELDAVIFGGGGAGLWLLDALRRRGNRVLLLEAGALGAGQTVASQGIIHGGVKYMFGGGGEAEGLSLCGMPDLWRACHRGEREPDLSAMRLRSPWCCIWGDGSWRGRVGMLGIRLGLRSRPSLLAEAQCPEALVGAGAVYRVEEPVIDTVSFVEALRRRNLRHLLRIEPEGGLDIRWTHAGQVELLLREPEVEGRLRLWPRCVVLLAGAGNARLRQRFGLDPQIMQRRPLHMALVRGRLPQLHGHCVQGADVRLTITSVRDEAGRTVWQVGGRLAERGTALGEQELVRHARRELAAVLPAMRRRLEELEWATYRADRAEGRTERGERPSDTLMRQEGPIVTGWPTKLALAPALAEQIGAVVPPRAGPAESPVPDGWPRPLPARPPWEQPRQWTTAP